MMISPHAATNQTFTRESIGNLSVLGLACALILIPFVCAAAEQQQPQIVMYDGVTTQQQLTPLQREIEKQRQKLSSSKVEERRDAVLRLGNLKRADASRAALNAINDSAPIVRATAAHALLALPPTEVVAALNPLLLRDRNEFVRQEVAYALGATRSRIAIEPLLLALARDKKSSVRGAAAVSLGLIGDEAAVMPLSALLSRRVASSGLLNRLRGRDKIDENEFVRRASARALGQIKSRAAVPALIATLADQMAGDDVRREAARALGLIGDPAAVPALRAALTASDPYLSQIADEALRKISPAQS